MEGWKEKPGIELMRHKRLEPVACGGDVDKFVRLLLNGNTLIVGTSNSFYEISINPETLMTTVVKYDGTPHITITHSHLRWVADEILWLFSHPNSVIYMMDN